jgi:uncharacterized phage infection (PIP) family protein YhgE
MEKRTLRERLKALIASFSTELETLAKPAPMKECAACKGSGEANGNPCDVCDGEGEVPVTMKAAESAVIGDTMHRQTALQALAACGCTAKNLESASDELLTEMQASAEAHKAEVAGLTTKITTLDAELKTAQAGLKTNEDAKVSAHAKITALEAKVDALAPIAAEHDARVAVEKTNLIKSLEASKVETIEQLTARSLDELKTLAKFAKVETVDYSGRGIAMPRTDHTVDSTPPNPYEVPLKALRSN